MDKGFKAMVACAFCGEVVLFPTSARQVELRNSNTKNPMEMLVWRCSACAAEKKIETLDKKKIVFDFDNAVPTEREGILMRDYFEKYAIDGYQKEKSAEMSAW